MEINKDRHEVLIRCLNELYKHTKDENERQWVQENIRLMTKLYDRYFRLRDAIRRDTLQYTEIFKEIRPASYKLLRKKQIAERELFIKQEKEKEMTLRRSMSFPTATSHKSHHKTEQKNNANLKDLSLVRKNEGRNLHQDPNSEDFLQVQKDDDSNSTPLVDKKKGSGLSLSGKEKK